MSHLSPSGIDHYRDEGFVVPEFRLQGEQVTRLRAALDSVIAANPETRPEQLVSVHTEERGVEGVRGDAVFLALARNDEILDLVEQLIGPDLVLWGCQAFCKPAGDGMDRPKRFPGWARARLVATDMKVTNSSCPPAKRITRTFSFVLSVLFFSLQAQAQEETAGDQKSLFIIAEPGLKSVAIDSDDRESFLGLALDSAGRLFAGCREALFVYEPKVGGLYQPRQLLFRFPKHSWVYDIAIRGDDLYVSTHWAIYLLKGAVKRREGIEAKRLVWGLPQMKDWDMHQGIHDLTIGPDGDLYFSNGDQIESYGIALSGVWDHWMHWTYFHGTKGTKVTGVGGVFRISSDGEEFSVVAMGTRNSCGMAFDREWNLFTTDNDHESRPKDFIPGRLLHVTSGAYCAWPRGWMPEKTPWRADLLDTMHPDVGRYVPTGMAYHDDTFLPEACRHSLYVAEWGRGKLERYPLRPAGASFKAELRDFFSGPRTVRPVGVAVGRGGRIFTSVQCITFGSIANPEKREQVKNLLAGHRVEQPGRHRGDWGFFVRGDVALRDLNDLIERHRVWRDV